MLEIIPQTKATAAGVVGYTTAAPPYVRSEVGRLTAVLVHEPGPELHAVASDDAERSLFSRKVSVGDAAAQHRTFTDALRGEGVEVVYLRDILRATQHEAEAGLGGGALPNLMFVRDQSVWIGHGVAVAGMATRTRRSEAELFARVYAEHPRFAEAPLWQDTAIARPRFEGGDVLVAGERRVVIGVGGRTTPSGAKRLAHALLSAGCVDEVATLRFPHGLGFHLDLVLTMVDRDAVAVRRGALSHLRGHLWNRGPTGIEVASLRDPLEAFPGRVRAIELDEQRDADDPRAWDCGVNVLAVAPGRVIAYADNERANDQLRRGGIEVVAVEGATLAAGRGGPHCLTCPLIRER